jgi:hypothetical protein
MKRIPPLTGRFVYLITFFVPIFVSQSILRAQYGSHEYIMPDGSSYICRSGSDSTSCNKFSEKDRQWLYKEKTKIIEKYMYCQRISDDVFKENQRLSESYPVGHSFRLVPERIPGTKSPFDVYRKCMDQ